MSRCARSRVSSPHSSPAGALRGRGRYSGPRVLGDVRGELHEHLAIGLGGGHLHPAADLPDMRGEEAAPEGRPAQQRRGGPGERVGEDEPAEHGRRHQAQARAQHQLRARHGQHRGQVDAQPAQQPQQLATARPHPGDDIAGERQPPAGRGRGAQQNHGQQQQQRHREARQRGAHPDAVEQRHAEGHVLEGGGEAGAILHLMRHHGTVESLALPGGAVHWKSRPAGSARRRSPCPASSPLPPSARSSSRSERPAFAACASPGHTSSSDSSGAPASRRPSTWTLPFASRSRLAPPAKPTRHAPHLRGRPIDVAPWNAGHPGAARTLNGEHLVQPRALEHLRGLEPARPEREPEKPRPTVRQHPTPVLVQPHRAGAHESPSPTGRPR